MSYAEKIEQAKQDWSNLNADLSRLVEQRLALGPLDLSFFRSAEANKRDLQHESLSQQIYLAENKINDFATHYLDTNFIIVPGSLHPALFSEPVEVFNLNRSNKGLTVPEYTLQFNPYSNYPNAKRDAANFQRETINLILENGLVGLIEAKETKMVFWEVPDAMGPAYKLACHVGIPVVSSLKVR